MAPDRSSELVDLRAHTAVAASLAADLGIGPSELVARLVEVWLTQVTEATELVVIDDGIATVVPIDSAAPVQTMLASGRIAISVPRIDRDDSGLLPRLTVAVPGSRAATDGGQDVRRRTLIAASVLLAEDSAVLDPPTGLAWCGRGGDESLHVAIGADGHHLTVGGAAVDPAVIGATADSLRAFVTAAIHVPSTPVRSLPLVGPAVHDSLLRACNDTEAPFPGDERLDERVWRWADARPEVVALADGDATLTYRGLIDAADALVDRLRRCGVGSGDIVAISMPRSFELVIAILAVVRCRAAYLPLDIAAPPRRNEAIRALTSTTIELVRPDDGGVEIRLSPVTAPPLQVGPDVACVMHTSGSTGHPKAVEVTTQGIQRLISAADVAAFGPQTVMAMVSSPAFDALTFELWGALGNGGRLEVIATEDLVDPRRFADALADRSVTTMLLTTAVFNTVSTHEPAAFRGLHDLVVGGEALDPGAVARVLPQGPTRLSNVYGPTECACLTTIGPIASVGDAATTVPIGGPLSNTTVDLVDRVGRLVPFGFEGEILIGGPAVGCGYVADPTATAAVFVESPLRPGRHYRTGDIARRLPDGRIDFVGRRDAQIKLRGHRIELGEIERALMSLDQVRTAAVIVQGTGAHGRLIAHVVGTHADVSTPDIRTALAARLSPVMVPAAVVVHDALADDPERQTRPACPCRRPDPRCNGHGRHRHRTGGWGGTLAGGDADLLGRGARPRRSRRRRRLLRPRRQLAVGGRAAGAHRAPPRRPAPSRHPLRRPNPGGARSRHRWRRRSACRDRSGSDGASRCAAAPGGAIAGPWPGRSAPALDDPPRRRQPPALRAAGRPPRHGPLDTRRRCHRPRWSRHPARHRGRARRPPVPLDHLRPALGTLRTRRLQHRRSHRPGSGSPTPR